MCGVTVVTWLVIRECSFQSEPAYCGVDNVPVAGRGEVVEEEEEGEAEEGGEYWEDHQDT